MLVNVSDMTQTLKHKHSTRDRGLLLTSVAPKCAAHESCTRFVLSPMLVIIAYDVDGLTGAPIESTIDSLNTQLAHRRPTRPNTSSDKCFLSNRDLDSRSTQLND